MVATPAGFGQKAVRSQANSAVPSLEACVAGERWQGPADEHLCRVCRTSVPVTFPGEPASPIRVVSRHDLLSRNSAFWNKATARRSVPATLRNVTPPAGEPQSFNPIQSSQRLPLEFESAALASHAGDDGHRSRGRSTPRRLSG
jgi:hypothetical protein